MDEFEEFSPIEKSPKGKSEKVIDTLQTLDTTPLE